MMRTHGVLPLAASRTQAAAFQPKPVAGNNVVRIPLQFAANTVKVMSYNAENFYDQLEDPKTKVRDIQWAKSLKSIRALGQVIQGENPDIIAFQEIENEQVLKNFNQKHLGGAYPNVVIYPTNDPRGIRVAFMFKNSVKLINSKSHREETGPNGEPIFSRDLLEATFETPQGTRLTLFNTHYRSMNGGEAETTPRRLLQAQRTKEIIEQRIRQNPDAKILFVGDLNTLHSEHGQPVLDVLTDANDPNPAHRLVELLEKDGTIPVTHEGGTRHPDSKLDYVYATPNLVSQTSARVVGQVGQKPFAAASDHLPIVITYTEAEAPVQAEPAPPRADILKMGAPRPQIQRADGERLNLTA
jgi:endonuclease/exonuclease/phosphatase family metal-dependent hydrolase